MQHFESWGRWPNRPPSARCVLTDRFASIPPAAQAPVLAYGNGRSYGDVCLNQDGTVLATRNLDRFISFDVNTGLLECESGVLLSEIIDIALPHGWFPPVTPGTSLVTVGGAIANDVHGKNHHRAGCFSHHVREFELLRSDGQRLICSMQQNPDWFKATVGGLGLTGLITRASLSLRRVAGPWMNGDSLRFGDLAEFFSQSKDSDRAFEYTVAWFDCAPRSRLGRGVLMRANHSETAGTMPRRSSLRVPFTPPLSLINSLSRRVFNQMYYVRPGAAQQDVQWLYPTFLYPLDGVLEWNRIYGPRGFFQYQCVIPERHAAESIHEMLRIISTAQVGSFLTVLKNFGSIPSLGMLSFARTGTTLAMDFPNLGEPTLRLLDSLDDITRNAEGAVYPAKDARMSALSFQRYFPQWQAFSKYVDPRFSSSFWRRVSGTSQ